MKVKEYYTPKIEDICVGYELEVEILHRADNNPNDINGKWWEKVTIDRVNVDDAVEFCGNSIAGIYNRNNVYVRNTFRTPYLTKEQIEAEGWVNQNDRGMSENGGAEYKKGEFTMRYWTYHPRLRIEGTIGVLLETNIMKTFSINEFRYITKMLNI